MHGHNHMKTGGHTSQDYRLLTGMHIHNQKFRIQIDLVHASSCFCNNFIYLDIPNLALSAYGPFAFWPVSDRWGWAHQQVGISIVLCRQSTITLLTAAAVSVPSFLIAVLNLLFQTSRLLPYRSQGSWLFYGVYSCFQFPACGGFMLEEQCHVALPSKLHVGIVGALLAESMSLFLQTIQSMYLLPEKHP